MDAYRHYDKRIYNARVVISEICIDLGLFLLETAERHERAGRHDYADRCRRLAKEQIASYTRIRQKRDKKVS